MKTKDRLKLKGLIMLLLLTNFWSAWAAPGRGSGSIPGYTSSNVFINGDGDYLLVSEQYSFSNQGGGPSYFKYDPDGALTEKIFERSDGIRTVTRYFYDKRGILLESIRDFGNGKKDLFSYIYNDQRKLVKRVMKRSNGQRGSESYLYGPKGELAEARWINFDGWISGTIRFQHNNKHQITKGQFRGKRFNAEIDFSYDSNGNLHRIHWQFSFGQSQTYVFKYRKKRSNP